MTQAPVATCGVCLFHVEGLLHATHDAIKAGNMDEAATYAARALDALLQAQSGPSEPEPHH